MRSHPRLSLLALYCAMALGLGGSLSAGLMLGGDNQANLNTLRTGVKLSAR